MKQTSKGAVNMKKYYVVATKWNNVSNEVVKYIAGEFTEYGLARLFKEAYNEHFNSNATILELNVTGM